MVEVREYLAPDGHSPYGDWFDRLNAPAAAKVATALTRLSAINFSNIKSVGSGLFVKIDFGPGYRVYFGSKAISVALAHWQNYKRRKQNESDDGPNA